MYGVLLSDQQGVQLVLNRGCYPVQWDRNWSRGLVLRVLARKKLEKEVFVLG